MAHGPPRGAERDILAGLSPAQVSAVTCPSSLLAVVAGPGSGKTRVLTRRVAWRCHHDAAPAHVLVLTFSRRAATELHRRLWGLGLPVGAGRGGVVAGTFHAVAWGALARHAADRGQPAPVLTRPGRHLGPLIREHWGRDPWPGEIASLIAAVGRMRRGEQVDRGIAELAAAYSEDKRRRKVLDLDDLLEHCAALFASDPAAAEATRWRHRHLFVDEYQDLTPAHQRLLRAWCQDDLCVVGDPEQAVYGFNGAVAGSFHRIGEEWPGIEVVRLPDNFRSTPEVVAMGAAVVPDAGMSSTRHPGPLPVVGGFTDEAAEARAVAAAVAARCRPGRFGARSWSGSAVLARTNARLRVVGAALTRAGIPWRLRDNRPLTDRPEVRELLALVPSGAPVSELAAALHDVAPSRSDASGAPDAEGAPDTAGGGPDRDALLAAIAEHPDPARLTVAGLTAWLEASGARATEIASSGVELVTFHQAKGLEWRSVWVVGVEDGLVPLRSGDPDEEKRLLYVALSRAEDELWVSWSAAAGRSHWIDGLERAAAAVGSGPPPEQQRAKLAALRGGVDPGTALAAGRRAQLDVWRAARALRAGVAPGAILPDRVLSRLARADAVAEETVVAIGGRAAAPWAPELVRLLTSA